MQVESLSEPNCKESLMEWANSMLKLKLTKLSQFNTGTYLCQLFDMAYPRRLPLVKIVLRPACEFEYQRNFKLLIDQIRKVDPKRMLNTDRLMKGPYDDTLALLAWFRETVEAKHKHTSKEKLSQISSTLGLESMSSQPSSVVSKKFVSKKSIGVSTFKSMNASKKTCREEKPIVPLNLTYDEWKVKQIEDILERERNAKASSKLDHIRRILFSSGKDRQQASQLSQTKQHINEENSSALMNLSHQPGPREDLEYKGIYRLGDRGRESLLLSVPPPEEVLPASRRSTNLLECDIQDK